MGALKGVDEHSIFQFRIESVVYCPILPELDNIVDPPEGFVM